MLPRYACLTSKRTPGQFLGLGMLFYGSTFIPYFFLFFFIFSFFFHFLLFLFFFYSSSSIHLLLPFPCFLCIAPATSLSAMPNDRMPPPRPTPSSLVAPASAGIPTCTPVGRPSTLRPAAASLRPWLVALGLAGHHTNLHRAASAAAYLLLRIDLLLAFRSNCHGRDLRLCMLLLVAAISNLLQLPTIGYFQPKFSLPQALLSLSIANSQLPSSSLPQLLRALSLSLCNLLLLALLLISSPLFIKHPQQPQACFGQPPPPNSRSLCNLLAEICSFDTNWSQK